MSEEYASIINRERVYSEKHPQMPNHERASQFAPFAALTGYDDAVAEMARLTTARIPLGDDAIAELDRKLRLAGQMADTTPELTVLFFLPDKKKAGGAYLTKTGRLAAIREDSQTLLFTDGDTIPIPDIYDITGRIFSALDES